MPLRFVAASFFRALTKGKRDLVIIDFCAFHNVKLCLQVSLAILAQNELGKRIILTENL